MRPLRPRSRILLNLAKSTQTVYYKTWGFHHILYRSKHASVNVMDPVNILGIETSCDDTGTAVVNGCGQVLGEGYYSQVKTSVKFGGILPSVARKYHEQYIEEAVIEAFEKSSLSPDKITAVAATVKPGDTRSLTVGAEFGKNIALKHNLPFIPIHHMEAHALTVRMENKVEFPFLVLLASGGHCLLAIAHSIDEWSIIGETVDISPGNALDLVARRMKLRNICGMDKMVGGRAIEVMAKGGDPTRFPFTSPMTDQNDANFSFSGLASYTLCLIKQFENEKGIEGGIVLDEAKDLCASFQCSLFNHILRRTHKGLKFAEVTERIPKENKTLVISGGVASNQLLRVAFEKLCEREEYRLLIPPPKLCTDNGIMVAWNGVEKWKTGKGILHGEDEIRAVIVQHQCPLGANLSSEHRRLRLYYPKCVKIPFATDISL